MSAHDRDPSSSTRPPPPASAAFSTPRARAEVGLLLRIAAPLSAGYLAEYAMFLTTKAVVGKLGYQQLAAVGLSGDLTFEVLVVLMGLLSVVGVLVAQADGAGRNHDAGNATRQGLLLATGLGLLGMLLVWNLDLVMAWTGQEPVVIELARPYLHALVLVVLPTLWFAVLRSFIAALARTGIVMVITSAAVGLNYVLTVGLVHGRFGLPELGLAGAGWATSIVTWAMFAALLLHCYWTPTLRGYGLFRDRLRLDLPVCGELLYLGFPVAGLVGLETGLFTAVAILSGVLGAKTLAAYGVVMAWISIPFVLAYGLAEAGMVRVAHGIGRGNPAAARQSGRLAMAIGAIGLALLVSVPLGVPDLIVQVFLDPDDPGYAEIATLTAGLFLIVAVFQVFDGLQAIAARALRGLRDTLAPLWIAGFGYWVLGIGGGCLLAFPLGYGVTGLWLGLAAGLIVTGTLLAARFHWLTRRMIDAARPPSCAPQTQTDR